MDNEDVEGGILAVALVASLLGVSLLATGEILALGPLIVGILGFLYLTGDSDQINQWLASRTSEWVDSQDGTAINTKEDALTILRQRYARGEIDQAEFERRLNDLLETETVEQAANHSDETLITEQSQ